LGEGLCRHRILIPDRPHFDSTGRVCAATATSSITSSHGFSRCLCRPSPFNSHPPRTSPHASTKRQQWRQQLSGRHPALFNSPKCCSHVPDAPSRREGEGGRVRAAIATASSHTISHGFAVASCRPSRLNSRPPRTSPHVSAKRQQWRQQLSGRHPALFNSPKCCSLVRVSRSENEG